LPAQASPEADILSALGARSIVLVGMMGVGKSTIGRRMAARLKLPFVDADTEIEAAAGMTIPEIFERHGEPHFRDGEARVIARLLDGGPVVLATGGGAFMREETRNRIAAKAISIWLKADHDVIMRRVRRRADRPLLQTADPEGTVTRLLTEREPVYSMPTSPSLRATCRTTESSTRPSRRCMRISAANPLPRLRVPCDDCAPETLRPDQRRRRPRRSRL
jgi:shikimate kinase